MKNNLYWVDYISLMKYVICMLRQMICILLKFIHIRQRALETHEKFLHTLFFACDTTQRKARHIWIWLIFQVHDNEFLYCILKGP